MKLIVGLGNPGREYIGTRHNVGFKVVERLAKRHGINIRSRRNRAQVGEGEIAGCKVVLAKPMTFMNLSGDAVSGLLRRYRLDLSDVIVVCDDLNLPLGRIRVRANGSSGGQKGLKSIIHSLGSQDWPRIRVGIGSPRNGAVDHVLSKFKRGEADTVRIVVETAADAIEVVINDGVDQAMNRFNSVANGQLNSPFEGGKSA